MHAPLNILAVTNILPSADRPTQGVFIEQQIKGLRQLGLEVGVFYVDRAGQGMSAYRHMMQPLAKAVEKTQPALLHVMYGGIMADRVTLWNRRLPKIVTFHGSDLLGENRSGWVRKWISRVGIVCSRRAARRAEGVVVVSQRLKSALPRSVDGTRVRVIPCGIDLDRFGSRDREACRQKLGWDPKTFHVLFASNNGDPVKRPELAGAAVENLKLQGVAARLQFLRGVPNEEVPVWMNAADVLLLTSVHEGSPTVVKEALACGLPVVSVDVGDVRERLLGVSDCHLAAPEAGALAAKLAIVEATRPRVKARAQLNELGLQSIAHRLEAFYRETLAISTGSGVWSRLADSLALPC
jgi:glycosyltransferase involved in cell wall biosynthesis